MDDRAFLDSACQAVVDTAVQWMLNRVYALPEAVRHPGEWPEYAALLAHEQVMSQACLAGDVAMTTQAADAYCAAWDVAIMQRQRTACEGILATAQAWVDQRLATLPTPQRQWAAWPEYPALVEHGAALGAACQDGDVETTRSAARAYCAAWIKEIQQRRVHP